MDKLAILLKIEKLAAQLRRLGLHPITRAGRYIEALQSAGGSARELLDTLWRYGFQIQIIDESEKKLRPLLEWDAKMESGVMNLLCRRD